MQKLLKSFMLFYYNTEQFQRGHFTPGNSGFGLLPDWSRARWITKDSTTETTDQYHFSVDELKIAGVKISEIQELINKEQAKETEHFRILTST